MKIGLYTNPTKDTNGNITFMVYATLSKYFNVFISNDMQYCNVDAKYLDNETLFKDCEIVFILGGDGTILSVAELSSNYRTKLLAINLGSRGFLTETGIEELEGIAKDIHNNNYIIDQRAMISVCVDGKEYHGLNEIAVTRGISAKAGRYKIYINNYLVDRYTSDGVIVSTPTGSTAYNLSCGGPIVSTDVKSITITPISAHSLHTRPLIVNDNNVIEVYLEKFSPHAQLNVDGKEMHQIKDGSSVIVKRSEKSLMFIRNIKYDYYDRFLSKLLNWSIKIEEGDN